MDDTRAAEDNSPDRATPSQDMWDIVRAGVQHLRARLLDSSRRNPLIQVPFRRNLSTMIRFVDEIPAFLAEGLVSRETMRLEALPLIDEALPDEQSDDFLDMLEIRAHASAPPLPLVQLGRGAVLSAMAKVVLAAGGDAHVFETIERKSVDQAGLSLHAAGILDGPENADKGVA